MPNLNSTKNQENNVADLPIFMFDLPAVLDMTQARMIDENHPEFIKMQGFIEQVKEPNFKPNRKFIAIFNDRFDSIKIKNCYKRCYPSLKGCKLVEFTFTSPFMSSHSKIISNYVSKINSKTEVNLFIGNYTYNCMNQLSKEFLKLENLARVKINYLNWTNHSLAICDFEKEFVSKVLDKQSLKEIELNFFITEKQLTTEWKMQLKKLIGENDVWNYNVFSVPTLSTISIS